MTPLAYLQIELPDGLSWPSLSFIVLVFAVLGTILILWRRYLSRRMLMKRINELEALSAAGRAIVAAELDVQALCELIAREAGQVTDNRTFQVGLFDRQFYQIMHWTIEGEEQETPQVFDLSDGQGLVTWVRSTKKPLLVYDFEKQEPRLPATPRYVSATPPRSALFIPLVSGEETIGIVAAQSLEANRFDDEDLRRLMILANQAAAAIANARLYEQERMRAAHLELVGQIARQVNAVQDLDEIFQQVVRLTRATFGFHPVNIFSIDPETGDAILQASSEEGLQVKGARLRAYQGLTGAAAAGEETVVCNNTAEDERFVAYMDSFPEHVLVNTQSEIAIPLVVNDTVLGVLDVQSTQVGAFTPTEQTVLEALAAEVASAIYKAQQLAWQQGQAWITTAQLQIAEAISRSQDLDEVVASVTRLTPMLIGVSFCGILLWDRELERYRGTQIYGSETGVMALYQVSLSLGDWGALDAVHVGQEVIPTQQIPIWLKNALRSVAPHTAAVQLLPLLVSGQAQTEGVMLTQRLQATQDHNVSRPDLRRQELLQNVAQQTAQAIESARLRQAQQEEAWVNTALLQVAEAVNSLIDLNEILDTIVRLVPLLVGVESVVILVWNEDRQVFVPGPSHGISTMGLGLLETLEIDGDELQAMAAQPSASAFPMEERLPTATYFAMRLPAWLETVLASPSAYAFPLHARGHLVGAMMVGTARADGRTMSLRRLNILNGIAQQAATAVVNNQLYKESADRARLQQELTVAHEIQASFLPAGRPNIPGCDVASLWLAARQVSGDFYDFLPRSDGTWGIVIADVADKGVPAALFMALTRTILRTVGLNRKDPAEVLVRCNEIINKEARSDLFVTVFYGIWEPRSRTLTYGNGGHNPPLLIRSDGNHQLLGGSGMALGVIPEIEIDRHSVRLHRGDTLVMYTDGVTEAMNEDYAEFGMERLLWAAKAAHHLGAPDIVKTIADSVRDHAGDTAQFDDITMVVMKCQDNNGSK